MDAAATFLHPQFHPWQNEDALAGTKSPQFLVFVTVKEIVVGDYSHPNRFTFEFGYPFFAELVFAPREFRTQFLSGRPRILYRVEMKIGANPFSSAVKRLKFGLAHDGG